MNALWRAKWGLARLVLAAFLLYAVASDTEARLARLQYASLPDFDYAAEVTYLRAMGRYGEALVVADAGLEATTGREREAIQRERDLTLREQSSYLRRIQRAGMGALTGQGTSIESLVGAVAADFFIVGDVRDLVVQGGRWIVDGETDELILILSGVGIATTIVPEVDWVPAILKASKKAGAVGKQLGDSIIAMVRSGRRDALNTLFKDVRRIAERASPGGAARLLRHADSPEDVAKLARFLESQRGGAFALHIAGKEGADLIKTAGTGAKRAAAAGDAGKAVVLAARKGPTGVAWLRTGAYRAMLRPHWVVGVAKAFYKGNAEALAQRIAAAIDPRASWILAALAAWVFLELGLLARRFWPHGRPVGRLRPA